MLLFFPVDFNFEQVNVGWGTFWFVLNNLKPLWYYTCNIIYLNIIKLANFVLTKAVFQLLCLEVHTPNMWPRDGS